jgi:hypothetical protein
MQPSSGALATVFVAAAVSACTMKIFEAPIISMTQKDPPSKEIGEAGEVTGKYCTGDPPITTKSDTIGLIDEATLQAQRKHKVEWIGDAVYMKKIGFFAPTCVTVSGRGLGKSAAATKAKK